MLKIICGLGNSGRKFKNTRHNFGFLILDKLAKKQRLDFYLNKDFEALTARWITDKNKRLLIKPKTLMNNSGRAVKKICQYYKIKPEQILVAHDDFDLAFGQIKFTFGQGTAGHHGVESVIQNLGTKNFFRLRLGIRPEKVSGLILEKFVLQKFTRREKKKIPFITKKAIEILLMTRK